MTGTNTVQWHRVARLDELREDEPFPVEIGNTFIALVRRGQQVHGVSDICTHEFALLSDGVIEDGCIECPLHQARFELSTGERRSGPDCDPIRVYRTRIEPDGSVSVECD